VVGLPDLVVGSSCVLLTESPENTSDVNMTLMTSKGGREGEKNDKEAMLSWVRIGYRYLSHTSNLPAAASPLSFPSQKFATRFYSTTKLYVIKKFDSAKTTEIQIFSGHCSTRWTRHMFLRSWQLRRKNTKRGQRG
jgi:hypothetical protein